MKRIGKEYLITREAAQARHVVMRCLYVCLYVCLSVTFVNSVKMNKHIFKKNFNDE